VSFKLSRRSKRRLKGVHPDLVRVVNTAITLTPVDFAVLEGLRSMDRQRSLFNSGASQTLNSRHLTGHAVDLGAWVDGGIRWDWPLYDRIANAMKRAANAEKVPIQWGGDWTSFKDGPHFQLPRDKYPN
jgi:peptidoglycan L-alanyl-D-glutamate endopeptidase CwlK